MRGTYPEFVSIARTRGTGCIQPSVPVNSRSTSTDLLASEIAQAERHVEIAEQSFEEAAEASRHGPAAELKDADIRDTAASSRFK